jgi:hypothetical protein
MLILLAGACLFLTAACGDDDPVASADSYDDLEGDFMDQCAPAAQGAPDPDGMCQCAFDAIRDTVPLDELQAYNAALLEDGPSATPPAGFTEAITNCATTGITTP